MNIFPTDNFDDADEFILASVKAKQIQDDDCLVPTDNFEYKVGMRGAWVVQFPNGSVKLMKDEDFKRQYISAVTFKPADEVIEKEEPKELTVEQIAELPKLGYWARFKSYILSL